ncbi:hypothetical protein B0H14DRAFT_3855591 [Mycena olivaceomarginata]|nr:hypothetical protein B0H14DRAFT_3855591 [Mycena olivaceomarginata]
MSLAMKAFFRAITAAFKTPAPAQSLAGLMPLCYGFEGVANDFTRSRAHVRRWFRRGRGYENISLTAPCATQCGAGWPAANGHRISWYGIGCRRVRANSLHGCHAASRRTEGWCNRGWVGIHLVTSSALRTPHSALRPPPSTLPRSPLPAACSLPPTPHLHGINSNSHTGLLWRLPQRLRLVRNHALGQRHPVFNYLSDPSGANTVHTVISIAGATMPSSMKVKYLAAMSVAQKGRFTWAGQTFGRIFESDGRPMGQEDIQMVQCDTGAQTCRGRCPAPGLVDVPAPGLVFLMDNVFMENKGGRRRSLSVWTGTRRR